MDPIYALATPFRATEWKSASKKLLVQPASYDRTAIESIWRHCSRNRMRTNRRTRPLLLNDSSSKVVVNSDLCSENGVVAPKKSRVDASESFDEIVVNTNGDTDPAGSVSESTNSDVTGSKCTSSDNDNTCNNLRSNLGASESKNFLNGQTQCNVNIVQAVPDNRSQAVVGSSKAEECWWNKIDSHTWLQGLQSYLLLHTAVDVERCKMPLAVLPSNAGSCTVMANPAILRQVPAESAVAATDSMQREHRCARPVLTPVTGYKVLANGVLSAVPVYYFPVVNCSVRSASAVGCQQTYIGGRQSSMAAVDLVSFMHNYCLPPASIPQSSTTHDAVVQQHVRSPLLLSDKESTIPRQMENSYPGHPQLCTSDAATSPSSSSVCLTPRSLSSSSSAESFTDDASELTCSFSRTAVNSDDSGIDVNTGSLFSSEADLTIPGWFGKGLGVKRSKRRLSRQS